MEYLKLAETFEKIEATRSRLEMADDEEILVLVSGAALLQWHSTWPDP